MAHVSLFSNNYFVIIGDNFELVSFSVSIPVITKTLTFVKTEFVLFAASLTIKRNQLLVQTCCQLVCLSVCPEGVLSGFVYSWHCTASNN